MISSQSVANDRLTADFGKLKAGGATMSPSLIGLRETMWVSVPMAGMFEADKFAGGTELSYLI